ncbi:MAG TPA: prepilin peptidase [Candidatus Nitrosotenuis sp.]|jgi:leader peptidase (prepilin peptidase)/N-methyltransferase|nr:prepilin peptidase [Candidatus Nitrosotenuis sp.]
MLHSLEILLYPNPVSLVVAFIYGSLFGSFLNVVILRLPLERSIVHPGSACGLCGVPLKWWQNLPVLSYLLLRGRCHVCGAPFSPRYALVEALTGGALAFLLWHYGQFGWPLVYNFVFFCLLTVVFFMDLDHWIILDQVTYPGMIVGLLGALGMPARFDLPGLEGLNPVLANGLSSLAGMILGGAFFWAIQVVGTLLARQEAMGGGDVKLAVVIGAFLGWRAAFLAFLLSFFLGALVALPMYVLGGRKGKDPVPFGTFMALAAFPCALWGESLLGLLLGWPLLLDPFGP